MRPSARTAALFVLGYLALVAVAGLPLLRAPWPAVPMAPQVPGWLPGDGDPLYRLWWIDWLWSHPGALLESGARTDLLFAPFGVQLGLVQAQLVQGLAVLALRPLGDPALAYAVLWALSFLFTASASAALAWDVSRSRPGAFLAGLLAAFSSPFFVHSLEHVFKYLGFGFVPLALLALRRALERGGARAYGAVFAVSALILLSDWYNALYVLVGGAVLWVHRLATAPGDRRGLLRRTAALAALLPPLALVLWWTLAPVLARESDTLRAPLAEQASLGVDALNVLLPHPYHPLWGRFTAERLHALPGNVFEKSAFFGWALPLALALLAWRERRDAALRPWLLLLAVFAVLSLGPALHWGDGRSCRCPARGSARCPASRDRARRAVTSSWRPSPSVSSPRSSSRASAGPGRPPSPWGRSLSSSSRPSPPPPCRSRRAPRSLVSPARPAVAPSSTCPSGTPCSATSTTRRCTVGRRSAAT